MRVRAGLIALIFCLALVQMGVDSQITGLFEDRLLNVQDYHFFSMESGSLILLAGAGLFFWAVVLAARAPAGSGDPANTSPTARRWLGTFLSVVVLASGVVLWANPEGRFPWNQREAYISIAARSIKPLLYKKLEQTPEVVLFGSSVSFTIPADYLRNRWGIRAFNMALNGGGPDDFLHMLNFMMSEGPRHEPPAVVSIELLWRDLRGSGGAQMPLKMLPYMEPRQAGRAFLGSLKSLLRWDNLSDSIFTLLVVDRGRWQPDLTFEGDGTGLRARKAATAATYRAVIMDQIALQKALLSCQELDAMGVSYIEKIVSLSIQKDFAIIFYVPPVNEDFYTMTRIKPARFEHCRRLMNAYLEQLAAKHPNVFFKDLADYAPIATLGRRAYFDARHLTRQGSTLLLDALAPEIEQALKWAGDHR